MTLRDLFNLHKWRFQDLADLVVIIRHRGAPFDCRHIAGGEIIDIHKNGFTLGEVALDDADDQTFIPWHRVLVVKRNNQSLWSRTC